MADEHLLNGWVTALQHHFGPDLLAVALFGSRARGDATEASDWDLFVIVRSEAGDVLDRARDLSRVCAERTMHTPSLLVLSQRGFETQFPPIYLDVAEDAQILAGSEYLQPKLQHIRQIARGAGLTRLRSASGLHWQWRSRPRGHWRLDWDGYCDVA